MGRDTEVRVARLGIRFEPFEGRALVMDLVGIATDPADILAFARARLPPGAVVGLQERAAMGVPAQPSDGPVVLRPRLNREFVIYVAVVLVAVVVMSLATGISPDIGEAVAIPTIAVLPIFAIVWLVVRRARIVIDTGGVTFAALEMHGVIPWGQVRSVRRTILPNGKPALRLLVDNETPGRRWVLPLQWTSLGEADLLAVMRRRAAPHTFETP